MARTPRTKSGKPRAKTATRKAAKRPSARRAKQPTSARNSGASKLLPKGDGGAVTLELCERVDGKVDVARGAWQASLGVDGMKRRTVPKRSTKSARQGGSPARRRRVDFAECSRALAAAGHEARVRMLATMLEGPATYRALCQATGLKAGPLYHHVNQLRLSGLVLPGERDLYELTRGGRNLILTLLAVAPLLRDQRRRPS